MPLLQCEGLVKDYPGKRAVDGVDFDVEPGEIVGLLGPNGAGKSTTFRMACGLIAPTEGHIYLRDEDVTRWPMYLRAQHGLGYLPQERSDFKKLSVEDNIFAIAELRGESRRDATERVDRLLHEFGLDDKRKQLSESLSGGERRRLEIARAISSDPDIILLDEPCTGIDPTTIHGIQDIIHDLKDQGIAILITDHRERELLTIADRSYIIGNGRVLVSGDVQRVLSDSDAISSYFGKRFDKESIIEARNAFITARTSLRKAG